MTSYAFHELKALGITDKLAYSLLPQLKIKSAESGQIVWARGAMVEEWRLIITGLVAACLPLQDGKNAPVNVYGDHSWFGEKPIINGQPTPFSYIAVTPTQFLTLPASLVLRLLDTELEFTRHMVSRMAQRAQLQGEVLVLMKTGNPALRVVMGLAQFVEVLAPRRGLQPPGKFVESLVMPAKQALLAQLCGVSRTVFSGYAQQLQAQGWLDIHYGGLRLHRLNTWQRLLTQRRENQVVNINPSVDDLLREFDAAAA